MIKAKILPLLCACICLGSLNIDAATSKKNGVYGKMKAFGKRMSDEKRTKIKGGRSYYKDLVDSNPSLVEEAIRQSNYRSVLGPGPFSKSTPTFGGFDTNTKLSKLKKSGTIDGAWTQREDGTINLDLITPDRVKDENGKYLPKNAYVDLGKPGDKWSDYTLSVTTETIAQDGPNGASQMIFNSDGADPTKMNGWIFCNRADDRNSQNFQLLKVVDGKRVGRYKGKVIDGLDRLSKIDYKIKTSSDGRITINVNGQECINIANNKKFQTSGTAKVGGYNVDADFSNIKVTPNE